MNYYRRKRQQNGLEISEVANYLGIDYKKYLSIDRGDVKMPKNLIDKFNKMINRGKNENKIERINREELINNWWNEITTDKSLLIKKMQEFNIKTYRELSNLLGYKDGCTLSIYINKLREPSFDFKNRLYSFFENELNIQEPKIKSKNGKTILNKQDKQKNIDWYKNFDIKKWLETHNLSLNDFSKYIKMPSSTFYYYVNPKDINSIPYQSSIKKVKEGIKRYEEEYQNKIINEKPIIENITENNKVDEIITVDSLKTIENTNISRQEKLINKYTNVIDELEGQAIDIIKEITKLKDKLDDINKQKLIYNEILEDIKE